MIEQAVSELDSKIRAVLEHIKDNPGCHTNDLDGRLVDDLFQRELLSGCKVTHLASTSPEYIELRLTIDGERLLESLVESSASTKPAPRWYSNPVLIAI